MSIFPPGPQTGPAPGGYGTSRATGFRRCPFFEARWFLMCALIAVKLGCHSHGRRRKRHVDTTHSIAQCSFQGTIRCLTAEAPQTCRGCKSDRLLDVRALLLDMERASNVCSNPRASLQDSTKQQAAERTSEAHFGGAPLPLRRVPGLAWSGKSVALATKWARMTLPGRRPRVARAGKRRASGRVASTTEQKPSGKHMHLIARTCRITAECC